MVQAKANFLPVCLHHGRPQFLRLAAKATRQRWQLSSSSMRMSGAAIADFSRTLNWGEIAIPEFIQVGIRRGPLIGQQSWSTPQHPILGTLWSHPDFLAAHPSLNAVYLPAERRLLEPTQQGIDLNQLSEAMAFQKGAESRNAVSNYGRLDDQEFENFAKALCVAASLPEGDLPSTTPALAVNESSGRDSVQP